MRSQAAIAITVIGLACITLPSYAFIDNEKAKNTVSGDDASKLASLMGRAVDFTQDLSSVMLGLAKSGAASNPETYHTLLCVQRIDASAMVIAFDLYGLTSASQVSTMLQYELDERITLSNIKGALETTMNSVKHVRNELNQVLGGCARQTPLTYDKATSLLTLVEDVGRVVAPILQRVTINMLLPFPRQQ